MPPSAPSEFAHAVEPRPHAGRLGRLAALTLAAGLVAGGVTPDHSPTSGALYRAATTSPFPDRNQLAVIEAAYPGYTAADDVPVRYDEAESDASSIVYRHEGLDGVSFARPSLEVSRQVLEADSIESMETSSTPFFASLGIKLYMAGPHPEIARDVIELEQSDLQAARGTLLSAMNEISITPREVIRLAKVSDIVFAHSLPIKEGVAGGLAYLRNEAPGIIAINVSGGEEYGHARTWNHELGHQLHFQLDALSGGAFKKAFAALNRPGFHYKDQLLMQGLLDKAIHQLQRQQAVAGKVLVSDYSGQSVVEDMAETYASIWHGEMAPNPDKENYGTLLAAKRVLMIEVIDAKVQGFKNYLIGLSTYANYSYQTVPRNLQTYGQQLTSYGR